MKTIDERVHDLLKPDHITHDIRVVFLAHPGRGIDDLTDACGPNPTCELCRAAMLGVAQRETT